jgi:hypothetical protein
MNSVKRLYEYKKPSSRERAERDKILNSNLILANSLIKFDHTVELAARIELAAQQLSHNNVAINNVNANASVPK